MSSAAAALHRRARGVLVATLAAGLVSALAVGSCSPSAAAPVSGADDPPRGVVFEPDLAYADVGGEALRLNLARPEGVTGRLPTVVIIHGGAWRTGDRSELDDLARSLAQNGFVAATVGYRFCPAHVFPAQVQDVKAAVRWLRANADRFHIDPERVGAVGFSSGAHLAMLLGTMERADGLDDVGVAPDISSKVQAVVSYAGPADFELPATEIAGPLIADFLGGPLEGRRDVYRRASPVTYVSAGDAPMLFFHGADDTVVPPSHSTRMAEALQAAGTEGRVELLPDAGHGDWKPEVLERTHAATLAFLRERL